MTQDPETAAFSLHELAAIGELVEARCGLTFDASRQGFFCCRVQEHMQARRMRSPAELTNLLRASGAELQQLVERLVSCETSFFRYPDLFEALEKRVLPELHMKKFWDDPRALRVWSAGCSTGEEPYSVAITIADALEFAQGWNVQVLATDISRQALEHAARGVYSRRALLNLSPHQIETHFARVGDQFMIKPRVRNLVKFAPLNLMDPAYLGRFDCIFCMNVLTYLSPARAAALLRRFYESLAPGGYLFLDHSEPVAGAGLDFETIAYREARILQKPGGGVARSAAKAAEERL